QQNRIGGRVDRCGGPQTRNRIAALQQRSEQHAAEFSGKGTAAWAFIQHDAKDRRGQPVHASPLSRLSTMDPGASVRMFRICVSGGSGEPAATNSERTARG